MFSGMFSAPLGELAGGQGPAFSASKFTFGGPLPPLGGLPAAQPQIQEGQIVTKSEALDIKIINEANIS